METMKAAMAQFHTENGLSVRQADFLIVLATMAWGSSYLLMKIGLADIPPCSLIFLRFGIAFLVTGLLFFKKIITAPKKTILHSAILGFILFSLFAILMYGMQTTTTSNAAFLCSTTIVMVPLLQGILSRTMPSPICFIGVFTTMIGIGLLTLQQSLVFQWGDLFCLGTAFLYACHILVSGRFAPQADGLQLGIWQLGFAALFGLMGTIAFEIPALPATQVEWGAILGLALLCSAFGFIMQSIAQKYTAPDHVSLIYSLEPVFAMFFGFIFLHEVLSFQGAMGALLILSSVIMTTVLAKKK